MRNTNSGSQGARLRFLFKSLKRIGLRLTGLQKRGGQIFVKSGKIEKRKQSGKCFHTLMQTLCEAQRAGAFYYLRGISSVALLPILKYPDARLTTVAKPVEAFDEELAQLAADMAETMYKAPGVGLAATQVDRHIRMVVIDVSEDKSDLKILINPEILESSRETKPWEEGCLSVPGIYDKVTRPDRVKVRAQNLKGEFFELECDGLLAVCVQHEMDHLKGIVFVDHLSRLKKDRIRQKIRKMRLEEAKEAKEAVR